MQCRRDPNTNIIVCNTTLNPNTHSPALDVIPTSKHIARPADLVAFLRSNRFIARSDPELNSLSSARRPGRPTSTREERLSQRRTTESAEHASGFWLPDLRDADVVAKLREWNGDWVALAALGSFCRVDTKGEVRESLFPPRGGS